MDNFTTCVPEAMSREAFVGHFKDIYEHSPWVAERVFERGLSGDVASKQALAQAFAEEMLAATKDEQLALIKAHPDLAGKAAIAGTLTAASTSEQAGAGIQYCTDSEFAEFNKLNAAYKEKFGFPFIKAVKGSNRHAILAAFKQRIKHDKETEFRQALIEINKIASFRLADM